MYTLLILPQLAAAWPRGLTGPESNTEESGMA